MIIQEDSEPVGVHEISAVKAWIFWVTIALGFEHELIVSIRTLSRYTTALVVNTVESEYSNYVTLNDDNYKHGHRHPQGQQEQDKT